MTILQALVRRYERMEDAPAEGHAPAKIHFTIVLRQDGTLARVDDERQPQGRILAPKNVLAPEAPRDRRGEKIVPGLLWDPVEYALGIHTPDPTHSEAAADKAVRKAAEKHAAFRARHERMLDASDDDGARALLAFLKGWDPQASAHHLPEAARGGVSIAFRLDPELRYLHERPALRLLIANELADAELPTGPCLVTGTSAPVARLHAPIKGVGEKLAPLVSFNEDAFQSYGRTKGDNAPVSQAAAFAYATALNGLLAAANGRSDKGVPNYTNRIRLGEDTTVVFWAETAQAERLVGAFMWGPPPPDDATETAEVRAILRALEEGRGLADAGFSVEPDTRVYVLGLSPNAARLSVRFWREDSLGALAERMREHWADLNLDPPVGGGAPPLWRVMDQLLPSRLQLMSRGEDARRKAEKDLALLKGEVMRAILTGARYPTAMLAQLMMRIRADQDRSDPKNPGRTVEKVSRVRIAMLKAWLARDARKRGETEDLVALDPTSTNNGYQLGRLFAVLERLQRAAIGQRNATVRDRYFASASATPERVFPGLIRNAGNHLKKVRSTGGGGLHGWFEGQIGGVLNALPDGYPKVLDLQSQGRFGIGYYHQREALFRSSKEDRSIAEAEAKAQAAADSDDTATGT